MDPHLVESSSDALDKQSPDKIELQHFTHEHLLYGDADVVEYQPCNLCNLKTSNDDGDGMFSCKKCNFFVHKSCAEAPRYIHNFLHPMHPLELFWNEVFKVAIYCRLCRIPISYCGYKCSSSTTLCDFSLHIECATKSNPKDHQHSFINLKPTLFTCDVCGITEDSKCFSCMCSICQVQVHVPCLKKFPLSGHVRQRLHSHQLKLCYSFEIDYDFSNKFCKICSKKMNKVLCLYQCNKGCNYIAHVSCATSTDHLMNNIDYEEEEEEEEVELQKIDTEQEEVITHFSHPGHSLILSNIEPTYEVGYVCHGCVRPITAPFYTCDTKKCNFFLHKQCFELPKLIRRPIHRHRLMLNDFSDLDAGDIMIRGFTCDACQIRCNGFAYTCTEDCGQIFDVGCTLFRDTLQHASHKCQLTLVQPSLDEEKRCIACDSTFLTAFWCDECNFFLDLKCASLPITIGHDCPTGTEWTVKPLKLTYGCIKHAGGQYYCDLCAETRVKDLWFYNCEDCRDSIHTQCLLGDGRFMYGKSYIIDGHCHNVCVAKKPETDPLCDTCKKPCQHSPLVFCPTCKVYFHDDLKCCGMSLSSKSKPIKRYSSGVSSSLHANVDDDDDDDDDDGDDGDGDGKQVKHFSHQHNLIICNYDLKKLHEEFCGGCGMRITVPFYRCADKKGKCNFFLHKECFELLIEIIHPLHPDHPLHLKSFLDLPCNDEVGFICYGCDACSNCFVYTCLDCKFFLDVRCSLWSDTLVHESHQCTLILIDKKIELAKGERKCQACNSDCSSCKYICDECNFQLGLRCASLPKVAMLMCYKHKLDLRPLNLMCATIDDQDGSKKTNCDMCKGPREKEWFYYREDSTCSAHVRCSAIRTNFIKNGIEYKAYNHFHILITVTIKNSRFRYCAVCKEEMKDSPAVYCKKCDVYLHFKCCRELRRVI